MKRIILLVSALILSSANKQFRNDYEYNSRTDAFYKIHIEGNFRNRHVNEICTVEGASLLSGVTEDDISQIHGMMKKIPMDVLQYVQIVNDGLQHEELDEPAIINLNSDSSDEYYDSGEVITRDGELRSITRRAGTAFACKVNAKDIPYNQMCGIHATGYKYYASVGSCYKIPIIAYTWYQAYDECRAEGAHLAVINSDTERLVLKNVTGPIRSIYGSVHNSYFHIGFKAVPDTQPRLFLTIFNQTLEQAGFSTWSATEPNNINGKENCGSVYQDDGNLNDINCSRPYGFICEKEITH